jgi:ankyrin repeat protein
LVEKGARVNRNDRWGNTPLDDSHRHRHGEVIEYLRQQGATFGTLTQLPRFIQAASEGDQAEVKALLEFGNIDLDEGDYDRRTALHLAAGEGRAEIVRILCDAGANVNVEDRWGNRPIDDAENAKKNGAEIMELLYRYGARSYKKPAIHAVIESKKTHSSLRAVPTGRTKRTTKKKKSGKQDEEAFSGTIAYWPPELFKEDAAPTPSSDMWAAGAIMYILLTGS